MSRTGFVIASVTLASSACMVVPNPEFIESAGNSGTAGDSGTADNSGGDGGCPAGLLDCDGEPGCEADIDAPETCGSCNKSCEIAGELLDCVAGQCSGTIMFTGLGDTYVDAAQPDLNFGTEPALRIDEQHDTYIELPGLKEVSSIATINSAALHLSCTVTGTDIDVYRIEAPWDELSMTYTDAPQIDGDVLLSFSPQPGENVLELADQLSAWQVGSPKHSIALSPDLTGPPPKAVEFSSSEGAAPPYLVIDVNW